MDDRRRPRLPRVTKKDGQTVIISGLDKVVTAFNIVKRSGAWETVNLWENPDVGLYMSNGVVLRDVHRPVAQEQRAVLQSGCEDGQDDLDEPAATGDQRRDHARRRSAVRVERGCRAHRDEDRPERLRAGRHIFGTHIFGRRSGDMGATSHLRWSPVRERRVGADAVDAELNGRATTEPKVWWLLRPPATRARTGQRASVTVRRSRLQPLS